MSLRRLLLGFNLSKDFAYRNRYFNSASMRYPVGIDLSSLPFALTQKLPQNPIPCFTDDHRPVSLHYKVNSMIELSQLDKAAEISRFAGSEKHRDGPDVTIVMCDEIIGAMVGAKRYDDAIALFHYFFNECNLIIPSIVSINHIIKVHCDKNYIDKALQLYRHARDSDVDNEDTYRILTKGLVNAGRIYEAMGMIKVVPLWDSVVYVYLIRGFLDLGNIHKAGQLSDEFFENIPTHLYDHDKIAMVDAEFVDYWFRKGNDEKAMEIYSSIISIKDGKFMYDATSGNTFLKILLKHGKKSKAWALFQEMIDNNIHEDFDANTFDSETIDIMVNECFELGKFREAMDTFKLGASFARCYNNIIKFSERGMMSEAKGLFDEMWSHKGLVLSYEIPTFRSMINGYVTVGRVDDAQQMLNKMVDVSLLKVAVFQSDC